MQESRVKILVIDDHPFFLEGLKLGLENLEGSFFEIDTCNSCSEALKLLSHVQQYNLILCDLHLPEMNGIAFLNKLFAQNIWIPIAIISASENPSDIECAINAGASGFINKSLNKDELCNALMTIISGGQYLPPEYERLKKIGQQARTMHESHAEKLGITPKQFEVLSLMGQGLSNQEISEKMGITLSTTKSHTKALFQIFNVKNRTSCILRASKQNLLPESYLIEDGI